MEGAAPRSVNYADTLPLAVASTQNRRSFFPQNGQTFTDTGSNIIRIDVNADGLLDVQQSYLQFTLRNTENSIRVLDQGHVWIKRLTIESSGVILEDINNYNRLVSGILQPAQGSAAYIGEVQLSQGGSQQSNNFSMIQPAAGVAGALPDTNFSNRLPAIIDNDVTGANATPDADLTNGTNVLAATGGIAGAGGTFTGQYHLACGLLNMDKYLPLVLMGQGFTIQLELASGAEIGVMDGAAAAGANTYEISAVKYVAHIVDMQRDFYDMLRNLQVASGGSLMIGSSTFRHFTHTFTPAAGSIENINISARVRSLENILFVGNATANLISQDLFGLSTGSTIGMDAGSWNIFIGSVRYPTNQVGVNAVSNKGESYQELRKCFGALGSINHGGLLNCSTYLATTDGTDVDGHAAGRGQLPAYGCFGLSFKSWRHELEDGIDTSSRALPCRLELTTSAVAVAHTVDIYAQATILFYINMDGSVSASV
tara:strand:+ start:10004 stop:11455 length:1452 start_codon:yes stop_codon:yes gene_type:complete